uniref:Uncharacterized protein n=1 Tax=Sorghum bicolor TaxID=4558 RepID=C6JSB8_SORBI
MSSHAPTRPHPTVVGGGGHFPSARAGEVPEPAAVPRPGSSLREAKQVVLVQHGQSTWNIEGRIQGSSDLREIDLYSFRVSIFTFST